jgi:hypothetical protein
MNKPPTLSVGFLPGYFITAFAGLSRAYYRLWRVESRFGASFLAPFGAEP